MSLEGRNISHFIIRYRLEDIIKSKFCLFPLLLLLLYVYFFPRHPNLHDITRIRLLLFLTSAPARYYDMFIGFPDILTC